MPTIAPGVSGTSAGGLAIGRLQLDVYGLVTPQTMHQRNQEAMQNPMLASDGSTGIRRFVTFEYTSVGADRWAGGLAAKRGGGHLDLRIVADSLDLPGRIPGADESTISIDGDVYRGTDRSNVSAVGGEQDVLLVDKGFESRRCPGRYTDLRLNRAPVYPLWLLFSSSVLCHLIKRRTFSV
jgi:hypothetical protein